MIVLGQEIGPAILSLTVTIIGSIVLRALQPKVKIIWSEPHEFVFLTQPPDGQNDKFFNVYTRTIFVQNAGKQPAERVEVIFNWKPDTFNLWPILPYEEELLPDNRFILRARNLGKGEWFRIELLSVEGLPSTIRVRSKEGEGRPVPMQPMRVFPPWFNFTAVVLMVIGFFASVYFIAGLIIA